VNIFAVDQGTSATKALVVAPGRGVLMQVQADLLQAPVAVYLLPNATALGVAALARLGAVDATDPAAVTGGWSPVATYEPRVGVAEAADRLERWRRVAEATLDLVG
jgi:glycerol kinase